MVFATNTVSENMQTYRELKEPRNLGVSFVCVRTSNEGGPAFLLVTDTPKKEVSAGLRKWVFADKPALCYPGGGRSVTLRGIPEIREETLQSELQEEIALALSIQFLTSGLVQKFPFVVAQERQGQINQIAVTTALYWFDAFGQPEQKFIEDMCDRGQAQWVSVRELLELWNVFSFSESSKSIFRPQVLTTAYLWSIDLLRNWSDEAIVLATNKLNRKTAAFIQSESATRQLPIKNGAFNPDGSILLPGELSADDARFLYQIN